MSEKIIQKISIEKIEYFFDKALKEAFLAFEKNEVPIGAVVTCGDEIISSSHNLTESLNDPTAHAEVLAIKEASKIKKNWRLSDCILFVTIEPCTMCAGAIIQSRIPTVIFGGKEIKTGAAGSLYDLLTINNIRIISGIKEKESLNLLTDFFKKQRA